MDLIVRNGRVVTEGRVEELDIGVTDGVITAIGSGLADAESEVDAAGRVVMPGGVDSHVHLGQRSSMGDMTADDFWTGSRSAAHGGTTTIVPFAAQHRGMSLGEVIDDARERAARQMTVDYGFWVIVTDPTVDGFGADLETAAEDGLIGIKIYLTYDRLRIDGRRALDLMVTARRLGLSVMVHAEDDALVAWGREQAVAEGQLGPWSHIRSHSRAAERSGVAAAIALAEESGTVLVLAHLSTPDGVEQAVAARQRGVAVFAETCPHYLVLDESRLDAPMGEAAMFLCSPPLRTREESLEMIGLLADGHIHLSASDHSPYTPDQKLPEGPSTPFTKVANGLPGIEVRMAVTYTAGVTHGGMGLASFVDAVATTPARICGLYPRKGDVVVGADADLVVWDDTARQITYADLHDAVGYTPYEGMEVSGWPHTVVARGEVLVGPGIDRTTPGSGRALHRLHPASELEASST